ncbi:MAG: sigma-70 family RNA polymerase sigma factor [Prevotella sp.]|nr:sigma-70 family RNA polymerase sigma factor [Prevotella sp.]
MDITQLIERCKKGDRDALGELYEAYSPQMRSVCRRYVSDEQSLDDVLHDAFVIILTSFDRLRDPRRAEQWMMSIVRNVASKFNEHQNRIPTTIPIEEVNEAEVPEEDQDVKKVRGIPLEEVIQMVDKLPEGYGRIFRLSVFEGKSHREIAMMMGIEPHSSSSQLARAKKMLRSMVASYWAMLLLLTIPLAMLLFRKGNTVMEDKPMTAKQTEKISNESKAEENGSANIPPIKNVQTTTVKSPLRQLLTYNTDTLTKDTNVSETVVVNDTLGNQMAEQQQTDTLPFKKEDQLNKTLPSIDENLLAEGWEKKKDETQKWSVDLAYTAPYDKDNLSNLPYSYRPSRPDGMMDSPLPPGVPTISRPSSIENWSDYVSYLNDFPNDVNSKVGEAIKQIALSNANQPGEDKILRTGHHAMPMTWSLALKYRLDKRWGVETGLNYSKLKSEFEMGSNGNTINELQTIHYVGVPLKGIYHLYDTRKWGVYGAAGMMMEVPVHSSLYTDYYVLGKKEVSEKTSIHAPWQWSTTIGLGLQYHLTPHVGVFAEPSLQYFIPTGSSIETYRHEHPFIFTVPLGIRLTW